MRFKVKQSLIELIQGDIVDQDVDAIVNAANSSLLGGGGVDGAIHYAAGPELQDECRTLGGCPTGEARITRGYRLKARHIIHAVGPVYRTIGRINWDGNDAVDTHPEAELLAGAYRSSLQIASQHGIKTIAFPSISTGIYSYPLDEAAPIALRTVVAYLDAHPEIELVRFILWDETTRVAYERAATELLSERTG